jgi:ABC-type glutathione transport system ATPase component
VKPVLSVHLTVAYGSAAPVLNRVRFDLHAGEILGVVGQSGCGKSTLCMALLRLLQQKRTQLSGEVLFGGGNLLTRSERELRKIRGREIALVLQAAASALNPYLRIETQFREAWRAHAAEPWSEARPRTIRMFQQLNLDPAEELLRRYPGQISIGQAQRVLIALALLHRPQVLVMDEPTSALDFLARAEVLRLVRSLREQYGVSILYISHDLSSVTSLCDRIAILHGGSIVESGPPESVFTHPVHPVTAQFAAAHRLETPDDGCALSTC